MIATQSAFNYGNFGSDKKRTSSLPLNSLKPHQGANKGSLIGAITESIHEEVDFHPMDYFRHSLAEVVRGKLNNRVFN